MQELREENSIQMSLLKRQHAQEIKRKKARSDALRAECERLKKELNLMAQERVPHPPTHPR